MAMESQPMAGGSSDLKKQEVICIEAKQVLDFCFQEERLERTFKEIPDPHMDQVVECRLLTEEARCQVVERREVEGVKGKLLVCVAIEVPVRLIVGKERFERRLRFLKQVVLFAPEGTEIQCEVTGNCCCLADEESHEVTCTFDLCVVISAKVTVRVLVPILGLCAPKECSGVVAGCPPAVRIDPVKGC